MAWVAGGQAHYKSKLLHRLLCSTCPWRGFRGPAVQPINLEILNN